MANGKVIEMNPSKIGMVKGGDRTVLTLKESITCQTCGKLRARFDKCIDQHKTEVILDCKSVTFMDSEGLELLVRVNDELRSLGGLLKMVGVSKVCRDILLATRLINTLNVYGDIHEAIKGRP